MNFSTMSIEEIEARKAAIVAEMDNEGADLDSLEAEMRSANEELEKRASDEAKRAEIRKMVANSSQKGSTVTPAPVEVRNSKAYVDAYVHYLKTGDETECRSLLTTNASGGVQVPTFLQEKIETAWEQDAILSRVNKTYLRGNAKIPFELSADGAYVHPEGTTAPTEEALTFGLVTLTPETIKKWVSFSDEVEDMRGEEFLNYIYDEITYRITKKLADECIDDITGADTTNGATAIGVPKVNLAPSVTTIPTAVANLSDEANNLVVIMNRLTEVEFTAAYAAGNFAVDPFAGLTRVYTSHLPAYASASANAVYAIVADLRGMQVNYPNGDGVVLKYDNLTKKTADIVEVLGRQYAAHGITKLGRFVNLTKPAPATT